MKNFVFHNPTKVIFGPHTVEQIGPETRSLGGKALLVYGRASAKHSGLYQRTVTALSQHGVEVVEHGGVSPNPVLHHVREGIGVAKAAKVEVVVALGGGSVLDTAKAIRAGALVEHDVWKFFTGKQGIKRVLPLTCIPTLAGAGSEMNSGMVLTNSDTRQKFGIGNKLLYPNVSILDPETTYSVPPDHTAYGAADAILHLLEFYFTTRETFTPVQDHFIEGLVSSLMNCGERALAAPRDYEARAGLLWGAALALCGLSAAGLGRVGFPMHMIEHSLSALYDVPHGAGLTVIAPAWMIIQAAKKPAKFARLAERVFACDPALPDAEKARIGIAQLRDWFSRMGCPVNLETLGIPAADLPLIAENAQGLARLWRLHDYDQASIMAILQRCRHSQPGEWP